MTLGVRGISRIERINYITLSDGQVRQTIFADLDQEMFARLARLFDGALTPKGVELIKNVRLSVAVGADAYVASLWYVPPNLPDLPTPLLTTAGSLPDNPKLIRVMYESATLPAKLPQELNNIAPYIIERLDFGIRDLPAERRREVLLMYSALCQCLGWYILAPQSHDA